jgi:hypothetical protein
MTSTERRRESWKPRNGNYYISDGTWVCDRFAPMDRFGVVADILDAHESGTVKIFWYSGSTDYLSAPAFRQKLRDGRYAIDDGQHPYDKVEWETERSAEPGTDQLEGT